KRGALTLTNTTIAYNEAGLDLSVFHFGNDGAGGIMNQDGGTVHLLNSIVAKNTLLTYVTARTTQVVPSDLGNNSFATDITYDHTLIGGDPKLVPPGNHAGPAQTTPLL